jgi:hypothetical protein
VRGWSACSAAYAASDVLTVLRAGAPGLLTREAWDVLTGAPSAVYVRTLEVRGDERPACGVRRTRG